ncbi:hypothetical protein BK133_11045 [Paenibacillus sp. FSL H8-0548]|uniref:hypothetical protein n=1 Tax=Paenibacillus sp. FSL H8-0548 TaxID=1920422 RepID=UPI00096C6BF0|nr:hypothetical protein [Paenibacillus sp. FSL H8-0548]OMF35240.1 hypothetical protein BK133_11045 [Paenibacillus sp. FSL H8-0548]
MNHNPLQRKLRSRGKKSPYKPGTIGVSYVSEQIKKVYGSILSRRERKARMYYGIKFQRFTNGR